MDVESSIETYRWVGISLSERKCTLCGKDDIADALPVKASGDSALKISEYINCHWETLLAIISNKNGILLN